MSQTESSAMPRAAPARPEAASPLARAAIVCLAVAMPVTMAIANKSAPVLLGAAALLALLSTALSGTLPHVWRRLGALLLRPPALALAAGALLAGASVGWSVDRAISLRGIIEGAPVIACALLAAACAGDIARRRDTLLLAAGLALAVALIVFEKYSGQSIHRLAGARAEGIEEKRSAIFAAILAWPVVSVFAAKARYGAAAAVFAALALGAGAAHSGAALFGLAAGAGVYCLALLGPRFTLGLTGLLLGAALTSAPWHGSIAARLMPANLVAALSEVHAGQRIAIWSEFGGRVWDEPVYGHGFNTSQEIYRGRPARSDAEANRLIEKIHPHNIYIQIWIELGAAGVALTCLFGAALYRSLSRGPRENLPARLALAAFIGAVGLVSHSLWQPWWLAAMASACIFMRIGDGADQRHAEGAGT